MITQQQTDKILNLFVAKGKEFKGVNEIFAEPFRNETFLYATNAHFLVRILIQSSIDTAWYSINNFSEHCDLLFNKRNSEVFISANKLKTFFKEYQTLKKSIVDAGKANNELPRKYNKTYIVKFDGIYYDMQVFVKLFEISKLLGIKEFCQIFKRGILTNINAGTTFDFGSLQVVLLPKDFNSDESVIINNNILLNFDDHV